MSIKSKISALVQLANIDGHFDNKEKQLILTIAEAHNISQKEMESYLKNPEPLPPVSTMSEDDKFEYLFYLVQLMKMDSQVYLSEIKYCESLALQLGFRKNVISELSARIYSDPSITSDMASLKRVVKKYRL